MKAQVKHKVAAAKEQIKEKQEEATSKLAQVRDNVGAATPDPVRAAAGSLPERIMERPLPVVVVASLLLGWLIWKRR